MSSLGDIQQVKLHEISQLYGTDSTDIVIYDMMNLRDIGAVPIIHETSQ